MSLTPARVGIEKSLQGEAVGGKAEVVSLAAIYSGISDEVALAALRVKQQEATKSLRASADRLQDFNQKSEEAFAEIAADFKECVDLIENLRPELESISSRTAALVSRLEERRAADAAAQSEDAGLLEI